MTVVLAVQIVEIIMSEVTEQTTEQTAIYLNDEDVKLFKEFCKNYELYTAIAKMALDNPGGYVKLLIDENSVIRKVETSRTFVFIAK